MNWKVSSTGPVLIFTFSPAAQPGACFIPSILFLEPAKKQTPFFLVPVILLPCTELLKAEQPMLRREGDPLLALHALVMVLTVAGVRFNTL